MSRFFKLVGKNAVPVSSESYFQWIVEDPDHGSRSIRVDELTSGGEIVRVSTAFLMGINHRWMAGADPLLFETMIFGGVIDQAQWRYSTWEQAERGHEEVVARMLREMPHLTRKIPETPTPVATRYERILQNLCQSPKS